MKSNAEKGHNNISIASRLNILIENGVTLNSFLKLS